jgi:hypothetical protein
VFHAVPTAVNRYLVFHVKNQIVSASFPQIREKLNACMAVTYATTASVILSERQQEIFEPKKRAAVRLLKTVGENA